MDRKEILEAARQSSKGKEYEKKEEIKSNLLSALSALIIGAFLFFFEYLKNGSFNWGIAAIVMTACATQSLYEGIKLKKAPWIIVGLIQSILAVVALAAAIVRLVG